MLDSSRGLACIGVVAMHTHLDYAIPWFWGVMDFFFVMSGVLITRSLVLSCQKGRGTLSFLLYRALRLFPAYLSVMLVYLVVVGMLDKRIPSEILPYVLLYQNTDMILGKEEVFPRIYELLPFWSLIVEEHYYILWGFLFCVFAYAKLRINLVSLGIAACLFGIGLYLRKEGVHYWTLPGRFDGFLAGSIIGIILFMPHKVEIPEKWAGWLFGLGWVVFVVALLRLGRSAYYSYFNHTRFLEGIPLDVTCYVIVSVVFVLGLVQLDIRRIHLGRAQTGLAFLGLISYEIYLVHFAIASCLKRAFNFNFDHGALILFPLTMVISTVAAHFMHKALTAPVMKRREQIHSFFVGLRRRGNPQVEPCPIRLKGND